MINDQRPTANDQRPTTNDQRRRRDDDDDDGGRSALECPALFEPWSRLLRHDYGALERYDYSDKPEWPLTCPISVLAGKRDVTCGGGLEDHNNTRSKLTGEVRYVTLLYMG
jgi:surfactin synthase thioesterase subunit